MIKTNRGRNLAKVATIIISFGIVVAILVVAVASRLVHRDLTERERAEQALRASEDRFRSLIERGSDLISILDADGTLRYASPSQERILGFAPSAMVGKNMFEVGCESVDGHHRFFVKDNGVGVDERDQERVFMPFQRASRDPKCEGTGIGLAIVKRVVELHGGRIWLKSRAGEGTVCCFTVPK